MTHSIVLDIEVQRAPGENGLTWDDTDKLGLACAVVYRLDTDRFEVFGPDDRTALQALCLAASLLVTYNGWKFDLPVIFGVRRDSAALPTFLPNLTLVLQDGDLLRRIWQAKGLDPDKFDPATHGGTSLDVIARETLGRGKSGHGADAPKLFQAGNWPKLVTYCMDDVALTRDLYLFTSKYGYLLGKDGKKIQIAKEQAK